MQVELVTKCNFSYEFFVHSRFLFYRKAAHFLFCTNDRILKDRQAGRVSRHTSFLRI